MTIEHKPLKLLAKRMFPRFVSEDYPQMITFMEKVFEYMSQEGGQYDVVANLLDYSDVDNTLVKFERTFVDQYLKNFPSALASDVAHLVKNIRSFYLNKGTEQSYRFLFAALFNSPVNFKYPKFNVWRLDDGHWFIPTFIVLTDEDDNIPPHTSGGDDYDISKLIGQFMTGSNSGAVAFIEDVVTLGDQGLHWGGIETVRAVSIVEKEGTFLAGEQILLGDTLIQNGDFSLGLSSWSLFPNLDLGIYVENNQLVIEQLLGDVTDKYAYQEIAVEENTQYWLRYSLVEASQPETKVTVGYTPGANEIYDSGNLGMTALNEVVLLNPTAAGKTTIYVSCWNEMDVGTEKAVYDGISLVKENTANVPLLFISALESQTFTDLSFVDSDPDTITTLVGDFSTYIEVGDILIVSGSPSNDGAYVVEAVTATSITISGTPHNVVHNLDNVVEGLNNVISTLFNSLVAEGSNDLTATLSVIDSGILEGSGSWKDLRGMADEGDFDGDKEIVFHDNDYYQDFSYELQSEVSSADFEQVVRDLVHPSGFKLFAKVVETDIAQTFMLRRSIYDDLVFDSGTATITRTASGQAFTSLFRVGDMITVYNYDPGESTALANYGQYVISDITDTVITVTGTLEDEEPEHNVAVGAGVGIVPLAAGEAVSFLYDMFLSFDMDIVPATELIAYDIEYEHRYGFGNTWAQEERNRESNEVVIGDWEDLVIGDFETRATERFLFILPIEIDIEIPPSNILWDSDPITLWYPTETGTFNAISELRFRSESDDGLGVSTVRYVYIHFPDGNEWFEYEPFVLGDYGTGEYLVKYEIVSIESGVGDILINFSSGSPGTWYDADGLEMALIDTSSPSSYEHAIIDVTVAEDDGAGSPTGTQYTKRIEFIAYRDAYGYVVKDRFSGGGGTALTAHTPDVDDVGGGWIAHVGTFERTGVSSVVSTSGEARAVIDAGSSNECVMAELRFEGQDAGIIGRAQDANNYWELLVEDADTNDPILKLNLVESGSPTTISSVIMTGEGPYNAFADRPIRLMFDGDDIYGYVKNEHSLTRYEVTATNATFNTETLFGIHSTHVDTQWHDFHITNVEIGLLT